MLLNVVRKAGPAVALVFLLCLFPGPRAHAGVSSPPFRPHEKLTFNVRWAFIHAGEAVLEVLPMTSQGGEEVYHFSLTARTSEFVDAFYKVRDRIESFADKALKHSILYKKSQRGKRKREVVVRFDPENRRALYTEDGQARDPIPIEPGALDPLAVFYAFRLRGLKEGLNLQAPVSDGKKCVLGKARIVKRENIVVNGRAFDAFLVEPELEHIGGVFEKSEDAKLQVWVTADGRCIPVRIKSRVLVGSFIADLISWENVD